MFFTTMLQTDVFYIRCNVSYTTNYSCIVCGDLTLALQTNALADGLYVSAQNHLHKSSICPPMVPASRYHIFSSELTARVS